MDYPPLFHAADSASRTGQAWYTRLTEADLVLVLIAAFAIGIGSIGSSIWRQAMALTAAICLASAVILRWVNRARRPDRNWFDARAVAESVKTAAWRYAMRAEPFEGGDSTSSERFVAELQEIMAARPDLRLEPSNAPGGQVTSSMREVRSKPFEERKLLYIKDRVSDQVAWYARRSRVHRRRAQLWFVVGLSGELLAVLFAIIRVVDLSAINLVGFLTALAASATAFAQLHRNDEVGRSYGLASQELSSIQTLIEDCNEAAFDALVRNAEGAISREHTMWIAKRN